MLVQLCSQFLIQILCLPVVTYDQISCKSRKVYFTITLNSGPFCLSRQIPNVVIHKIMDSNIFQKRKRERSLLHPFTDAQSAQANICFSPSSWVSRFLTLRCGGVPEGVCPNPGVYMTLKISSKNISVQTKRNTIFVFGELH